MVIVYCDFLAGCIGGMFTLEKKNCFKKSGNGLKCEFCRCLWNIDKSSIGYDKNMATVWKSTHS